MLRVDPASPVPPYEQLRSQLIDQMNSGGLPPGSRLPSVRRLASDLGLAPNTVARTYRELEAAGFVRTAGRNGTIVAEPNDGPHPGRVVELTRAYVRSLTELGLGCDAALHHVRRGYAELEPGGIG